MFVNKPHLGHQYPARLFNAHNSSGSRLFCLHTDSFKHKKPRQCLYAMIMKSQYSVNTSLCTLSPFDIKQLVCDDARAGLCPI
jgi:hypothetical protein